jgi:hypothetical protein
MRKSFMAMLLLGSSSVFGNVLDNDITDVVPGGVEASSWEFDVYLDSRKIGFHEFEVTQNGEGYEMSTRAEFDVKVLFVNFYSYRHENTEVWNGGCLQGINARTDANGNNFVVEGKAESSKFTVSNGTEVTSLPQCVKTFSYWDPSFLTESQLLNSQTGVYEQVLVEELGEELIDIQGQLVPAVHYRLMAETGPVSLWYGVEDDQWLGLESVAEGGRVIRYEPKKLAQSQSFFKAGGAVGD